MKPSEVITSGTWLAKHGYGLSSAVCSQGGHAARGGGLCRIGYRDDGKSEWDFRLSLALLMVPDGYCHQHSATSHGEEFVTFRLCGGELPVGKIVGIRHTRNRAPGWWEDKNRCQAKVVLG